MATTTTALISVKRRLDIADADTTWDSQLAEFIQSGVKRLYPLVQREVAPVEVSVSVDDGEAVVDLSTQSLDEVRAVESYQGTYWAEVDDFIHHAGQLYIQGLPDATTAVKLYGRSRYTLTSSETSATVPQELEQAVFWYAMSEFYDFLAGNKRKYNLYTNNGARGVDNMIDLSDRYEQKANIFLNDHATISGA